MYKFQSEPKASHKTALTECVQTFVRLSFLYLSAAPFIFPGLSNVGAPWVWDSSHSDIASQGGVWVSCVPSLDA
jgi:hypothetical protein